MLTKYNVPVKKHQVLLKPKKLKLPKVSNIIDRDDFSDILYDADKDVKMTKAKTKKSSK